MKRTVFVLLLLVVAVLSSLAQRVSSYQSGSYYPNLLSLRDYAAAPAGLIFADYNIWFNTKGYYDRDGNKFEPGSNLQPPFDKLGSNIDPKINGYTNMFLLFYVSRSKILGARYMASVSPMYLNMEYSGALTTVDTSFTVSGKSSGFGDLAVMPLGLSWSKEKIDIAFMYSIYIPTGRYETGGDDNLGTGFWTHQLQLPTYLYALEKATALAIIPTLEFSGKVKDADVSQGSRFTLEYGISQYFTTWLEVEVMNGHNWQISDDKGSDVWWSGTAVGDHDSKNAFSVGINAWPIENVLQLRLKFIQDYGVKQRFKNQLWHFSLIFMPGILADKSGN